MTKQNETKTIMKKCKGILVLATATCLQFMGLQTVRAQQLFPAIFSATCVSTNNKGGLSSEHMGNRDLISDCAADLKITNLTGLSLVYNLTANELQVVAPTNQTSVGTGHTIIATNLYLLCTPLRFTNIVWLSTTNMSRVELLSSVFVETNSRPTGTLAATERFHFGPTNQLTSFSLIGRIQYAVTASGTNGASICRGVLLAGVPAGEEEGEEGEEGHGNNGNHGEGNNGRHLGHDRNGNHGDNGNNDDRD